jgi:pimeloyl-ACP methyl ester carboxylesterase
MWSRTVTRSGYLQRSGHRRAARQTDRLNHGWPLSSDNWDAQMLFFLQQGYRVVGIDRRGHGRSSKCPAAAT